MDFVLAFKPILFYSLFLYTFKEWTLLLYEHCNRSFPILFSFLSTKSSTYYTTCGATYVQEVHRESFSVKQVL